jgi:hypothetical protein
LQPAPSPAPALAPTTAAPEPVAPAIKEKAEEKLVTELPDIAISGRQRLKKLPEDSFVIEEEQQNL